MTATQRRSLSKCALRISATLLAVGLVAGPGATLAEEVIFTIDPLQSIFSSSGYEGNAYGNGAWLPQSANSLSAPLTGHFLVDFDPLAGTDGHPAVPPTLRFVNGHGYYEVNSPHMASPGGTPANVAGKSVDGTLNWAIRDLSWDFGSDDIHRVDNAYAASESAFTVLSGRIDSHVTADSSDSYVGAQAYMTGGSWHLSQSGGIWTLSTTDSYFTYATSFAEYTDTGASLTSHGVVVATAHYSAANLAEVVPPPPGETVQADALGGAGVAGGVSAEFNELISPGTLSVQAMTSNSSLSQAAVEAAATNGVFAASTYELAATPQVWDVDFSGNLNGSSVTLVFAYNPALLPDGFDESTLGIWHFNHTTDPGHWEFGGTVNTGNHTITYVTTSFSEWYLGTTAVPEPSTYFLAAAGSVGLVAFARRKRAARRS